MKSGEILFLGFHALGSDQPGDRRNPVRLLGRKWSNRRFQLHQKTSDQSLILFNIKDHIKTYRLYWRLWMDLVLLEVHPNVLPFSHRN